MERDILADVNHPFVVKLHYGESSASFGPEEWQIPGLGFPRGWHQLWRVSLGRGFNCVHGRYPSGTIAGAAAEWQVSLRCLATDSC